MIDDNIIKMCSALFRKGTSSYVFCQIVKLGMDSIMKTSIFSRGLNLRER